MCHHSMSHTLVGVLLCELALALGLPLVQRTLRRQDRARWPFLVRTAVFSRPSDVCVRGAASISPRLFFSSSFSNLATTNRVVFLNRLALGSSPWIIPWVRFKATCTSWLGQQRYRVYTPQAYVLGFFCLQNFKDSCSLAITGAPLPEVHVAFLTELTSWIYTSSITPQL